ncbi:hypothetical protein JXA85_07820 [Candidatus Woesearchaeota archaeon]|nr:hypothetical protein [Candidatus Woesearchaeota archaeon]
MLKRGVLVFGLFLLLLLPVILAEDNFFLEVKTMKGSILKNETAQFNLVLHNEKKIIDDFDISSKDVLNWDIYTMPRSDYRVEVFPESSRAVQLFIRPLGHISAGIYEVRVNIKSLRTNTQLQRSFVIEVNPDSPSAGEYVPTIKSSVEVPRTVLPGEKFMFKLNLRNLMPIQMNDVRVTLKSSLVSHERTVNLAPGEETSLEFETQLNKHTAPQSDMIGGKIYFVKNNITYIWDIDRKQFEVGKLELFKESRTEIKKRLRSSELITVTNEGNVETGYGVLTKIRFFDFLFAKTSPKAVSVEGTERNFRWEIRLKPGDSLTVGVIRDYTLLPVLCFAILVVIVGYFVFRSPILIRKSAHVIETEKEGINELKVKIHLQNRTARNFETVKLLDRIPKIIEVAKEFHLGTLKPDKILRHPTKPTMIVWNIPTLESYEERIITYKIKSKLSIVGGLTLPAAYVKYSGKRGKEQTVFSNRFDLEE